MKHTRSFGTLVAVTLVAGLSLQACADDDDWERGWWKRADFAPLDDPQYVSECGDCHMPYQPGMLPAASWRRIMNGLEDHFGDNAELDEPVRQRILSLLENNGADRSGMGRAPGVARSLGGQAPLRFTETRYFRRKHHEIPARLVKNNPDIGSFARCDACHLKAAQGNYDEHQVRIPGVGYWDD